MDFANAAQSLSHYKALAAQTLRADAPHPDTCPTLKIHGMAWAIPPRGQRVAPQINEAGEVTGITADTADSWDEIAALQEAIKLPSDVKCPTCGQATETTATLAEGGMQAAFALAARALRTQYDLTPSQLMNLLAYEDTGMPEWFDPLLRWASGLPPESPDNPIDLPHGLGGLMDFMPTPEPVVSKTSLWNRLWRRRA